jgi:hypothetical protein
MEGIHRKRINIFVLGEDHAIYGFANPSETTP